MEKIRVVLLFCSFLLISMSIVSAQGAKISIEPIKENFKAGENITFKVSLLDSGNNPINQEVNLILEDFEKKNKIEQKIISNKLVDIGIGNASSGHWKMTAFYKEETGQSVQATTSFFIESNELAEFELDGDVLTVTNIGNAPYTKTIYILIGETEGTKKLDLGIGDSLNFRLIAPDGNYNIRVTDGVSTLMRSSVKLTGNVIGILDERLSSGSPITVGVSPSPSEDGGISSGLKNKTFIYIFVIAVFGAMILLAVERRYRRRLGK